VPEQDRNIEQARWAAWLERRRRMRAQVEADRQAALQEPTLIEGDDELNLRSWLAKGGNSRDT
jgi:hypothetical protein